MTFVLSDLYPQPSRFTLLSDFGAPPCPPPEGCPAGTAPNPLYPAKSATCCKPVRGGASTTTTKVMCDPPAALRLAGAVGREYDGDCPSGWTRAGTTSSTATPRCLKYPANGRCGNNTVLQRGPLTPPEGCCYQVRPCQTAPTGSVCPPGMVLQRTTGLPDTGCCFMPSSPFTVDVVDPTAGQGIAQSTSFGPPTFVAQLQAWAEQNWKWAVPTVFGVALVGVVAAVSLKK